MEERLQKILSAHGVCSRRAAEGWLAAGRVTVNGKPAAVGDKADPDKDDIRVDGTIKGKIETKGRLILGPAAKVEGEVTAPSVEILGTLQGNIVSSGTVSLRPKAVVSGTIKAAYLIIESGALFNGDCHMQREVKQK